ncbi:peptidase S58 family protein [Streptacidiphilus pinicola]|uniref:Peptidase S58 family protein n=1 Tax=Streptacidiphilus pinicola TaxID=2219663 RepID=A0A2X0K2W9_9ACTN|nr:P1 family peptidase [Streptacidiphilus pinicola]RAG83625.1 peptidase S58 family protein [Streptacidiphilus pinicola]
MTDESALTNSLTDVPGFRVGHAHRVGGGALTGVTVVLAPEGGAVAGVDVRGGGPGTRETDALDPRNLVQRVDAVTLTGGSAFGLDAAGGVMAWLEEQGRGFRVGPEPGQVVPVVPTAALFDLGRGGDWRARPDAALGRAAVAAATEGPVAQGNVGAGTGAVVGGLKGGIGTASVRLPSGVTLGALVAVNAVGSAVDPVTGELYAIRFGRPGEFPDLRAEPSSPPADGPSLNTTLAVVATDTTLTKAQAHKLAGVAHDGLARALRPIHLLSDGDTVFALASGARPLPVPEGTAGSGAGAFAVHVEAGVLNELYAAAADTVTRAIGHAVLAAESVGEFSSFRDKCTNKPNCG